MKGKQQTSFQIDPGMNYRMILPDLTGLSRNPADFGRSARRKD